MANTPTNSNGSEDPEDPELPGEISPSPELAAAVAEAETAVGVMIGSETPVADTRTSELESVLVHLKADFDNYRKRSQKEIASSIRTGELEAVRRFLPAFANLERALAAAGTPSRVPDAAASSGLVDGVRQIHEQLQSILKSMGVERIPSVGGPFDPMLHDAVAATPRGDLPPGTVTDEFEPGYRADGRALIPAKVRVSTAE